MKFKNSLLKLLVTLLVTVAAIAGVYFLIDDVAVAAIRIIGLFLPFILAYFVSVLVNPLVDKLEKKLKIPRNLSTIIVILLTVGILGGIIAAIIWKIVDEARSVYGQLPELIEEAKFAWQVLSYKLSNMITGLPEGVQEYMSNIGTVITEAVGNFVKNNYSPAITGIGNVAKSVPRVLVWTIVFILSLFFMVSDSKTMRNVIGKVIPKRSLVKIRRVQREVKKYLGGYVKAQLIIMSIAAVLIFIGLSILGVEFALLIALGIAVLDALPFFGSGAVLWPWSIIGFINGDLKVGFGLIIIYLAVIFMRQMIEPKIVSESIGVYPVFTLMSMYLGYRAFSIGGMILGPICLILVVSFYKAGAFDGIIRFLKKFWQNLSGQVKELFSYLK